MTRKLCPFCGCNHSRRIRKSFMDTIDSKPDLMTSTLYLTLAEVIRYYIECCYCHTRTDEYNTVKEVEEAWRKRH